MNTVSITMKPARYLLVPCVITLLGACGTSGSTGAGDGGSGQDLAGLKVEPALIVRHSGSAATGYYQLGRRFQEENRLHQAVDAYRKAIALDSGHVDAHSALGTALAQQGKLDDAAAEFKLAVDLAPQSAYLHNNLGYLYLLQGRLEPASASLTRAVALDPGSIRNRANLALVQQRLGLAPAFDPDSSTVPPTRAGGNGERVPLPSRDARPANETIATATAAQSTLQAPARTRPNSVLAVRFEIADGSRTSGVAEALTRRLAERGLSAPVETRQLQHSQHRSVILYRKGYRRAAMQMGAALDMPVAIATAADGSLASGTDLKLVIGRRAASRDGADGSGNVMSASLKAVP